MYRTKDNDKDFYNIYFYSNFNDSLFCYQAAFNSKYDMDKAAYKWVNDTLASIRLYNTRSKGEIKLQVFGKALDKHNKTEGLTYPEYKP